MLTAAKRAIKNVKICPSVALYGKTAGNAVQKLFYREFRCPERSTRGVGRDISRFGCSVHRKIIGYYGSVQIHVNEIRHISVSKLADLIES